MAPSSRALRLHRERFISFGSGACRPGSRTLTKVSRHSGRPTSQRISRRSMCPPRVMHGEDDQIVPVKDPAKKSARLIKGAQEIYYPGAPHGLTATHQDKVNADLLEFLEQAQHALKK